MRLLQLIVQRHVFVILLTVFIIILGTYTFFHLEKELTPTVGLDSATIQVEASNLHVDEVERKITIPLEQKLQELEGIKEISSTTSLGHSSLAISFDNGKGDEIFKDVESKTTMVLDNMSEIDHFHVSQNGVNTPFEFIIDVSDGNLDKMTAFTKNILQPRLEELPEVREVMFTGASEHKVDLHFNEANMKDHHLTIHEVVGYIQQINSEGFLGELTDEKESPSLHWDTTFENIDELESLQIPTENGVIKLSEIATIAINPLASSSNTWKNGTKDVIMIQIARKSDVAQAAMTEAVRNELQNIEKEGFVKGFTVNEVIAHADFVQDSMDDVTKNIMIGGVIALVVLLLFLRNVRTTFIIGLSIPTSILLTIIMMGLLDYSMNLLTLIGLGLGIGMMVDASIVILESIYRKKEQGLNNLEAVLEGTKEVATAIIASVLTTIVVFLPIGFIGGDSGKFMLILSVVVAVTLISSVLIAFTLIPTLAKEFMKLKKQKSKKKFIFLSIYENIVSWCIKKKSRSLLVIVASILVFSLSFLLIPKIQMNMMPDIFNRYTEIIIDLENGVSPNDKETIAEKVNDKLSSMDDVKSNYLLDFDDKIIANIVMTTGNEVTKEQDIVTNDIVKTLRELEKTEPIRTVERALDGVSGYPVQVNISGDDFSNLQKMTNELQGEIEAVDGIVRATNTLNDFSTTETIQLDKEKIKEAELSELQIKQHIEQYLWQEAIGTVEWEEEELRLYVHQDNEKMTKDALLQMEIPTKNGEENLSSFITFEKEKMPEQISHKNGERYVSIMADVEEKDLGMINNNIHKVIDRFKTDPDYTITLGGDLEEQNEFMNELLVVFGIALFLVYVVMAVQFNHFGQPLIVMSIIPITIVGVILGLFFTQAELNIMSGLGLIILVGIVLNNAILIIDRTNQLRKTGMTVVDSLIQAGENRIRPILMTTFTTVGGMIPLALATGMSADYQAPLSIVIISGMLFSTFITLLLIPCVYRLFSRN